MLWEPYSDHASQTLDTSFQAIAMPISGLVVTFHSPVEQMSESVDALRAIPEVELGQAEGHKLAIVVDSFTSHRDRAIWDAVQQLPGIADVAIAMIAYDEDVEVEN